MKDYTWKVMRCGNPNKAWIVTAAPFCKLSALMSLAAAERIATEHNLTLKYIQNQTRESGK
jgi:hypothetical protein